MIVMVEQGTPRAKHTLLGDLLGAILPAIPFGLGVGYATGQYPESFVTGLALGGAITALTWLDVKYLHPLWRSYPRDLRVALEIGVSAVVHILGILPVVFVCSRIFNLAIDGLLAWLTVGAAIAGFLIIYVTGKALQFHREMKIGEDREEQLTVLAIEAELRALKAQINPHFLFNTLNTIAGLIHTDPARAEGVVERLADIFRYVLTGTERGLVPLADELTFVDSYLEIERIRFGSRLCVTRCISSEVLEVLVPSLILQPLVENAVRHGQSSNGSIDLSIQAVSQGNVAIITVADRGPGMPPGRYIEERRGYGLRNVDERLQKTYGKRCRLEIEMGQQGGAIVTLKIPMDYQGV